MPVAEAEAQATAPETPPQQPAQPAESSSPPQASDASEGQPTPEEPQAPSHAETWKNWTPEQRAEILRGEDFDALTRQNDWLAGKIGKAKQQTQAEQDAERRRLEANWRAEWEREQEDARLREAVQQDDAFAANEILKKRYSAEDEQRQTEQQRRRQRLDLYREVQGTIGSAVQAVAEALPDGIGRELLFDKDGQPRRYAPEGSVEDGLREMLTEAVRLQAAPLIEKARTESYEAGRRDALAQVNGGEPTPQRAGGAPPPGALTRAEFAAHEHDLDWIKANRARIQTWMQAGQP